MFKRLLTFLFVILLISPNGSALAAPTATPVPDRVSEQRRAIERYPLYDATAERAICDSLGASASAGGAGGPLYFLGDFIGGDIKLAGFEESATTQGFSPRMNISPNRSISAKGVPATDATSGLEAIAADAEYIKGASVVIVELGTNVEANFSGQFDLLMTALQASNKTARYYVIDIAAGSNAAGATNGSYAAANKVIYQKASQYKYQVISRFKMAYPAGDAQNFGPLTDPKYSFDSSAGLAFDSDGNVALRDLILEALKNTPPPPTSTTGAPTTSGGSAALPGDARQKLLAIKNIGGPGRVDAIMNHIDWYQEAGAQGDVPWQMLVAAHFREGLGFDKNPSNGQGVFQLYSLIRAGQTFPAGPITREEWIRQAVLAAKELKSKVGAKPSPINVGKTLTKETYDSNLIKDVLFAYNGKGEKVIAIGLRVAAELNFSPPENYIFEGSAYVMNFYDGNRNGMEQCAVDGCDSTNKSANPGAYLIYEALAGVSGGTASTVGACASNLSGAVGGIGAGSVNGNLIVSIATAEIGVKEGSPRMLEYTNGINFAWCASFVSWVYKQAGQPFGNGSKNAWLIPGVSGLLSYLQSKGEFHTVGDGYIPSPGDIVIFKNNGESHTGIVEKADENGFSTIEGNASHQVKRNDYKYTYKGLTGFGKL